MIQSMYVTKVSTWSIKNCQHQPQKKLNKKYSLQFLPENPVTLKAEISLKIIIMQSLKLKGPLSIHCLLQKASLEGFVTTG